MINNFEKFSTMLKMFNKHTGKKLAAKKDLNELKNQCNSIQGSMQALNDIVESIDDSMELDYPLIMEIFVSFHMNLVNIIEEAQNMHEEIRLIASRSVKKLPDDPQKECNG